MANTHRKESWTAGVLSFGGKDYPIVAGNTYSAAPVGIGTYLAEGQRYVIFWEKGDNQGIFQTSLESTYDRASKKRVIVAEITVPSSASGNFVDGNDVKADIKADGQASTLTDVSHIWKGTAALPAYSFSGDVDTGMYSDTADQIQFSTGGTQRLEISSSGVTATTFIGALTGNADTATSATSASSATTASTANTATYVTASANNTTNETVYPTFVDGATGTQGIETDTGLTYNPSTGTLTSLSFTGGTAYASYFQVTGITADGAAPDNVYGMFRYAVDGGGTTTGSEGVLGFLCGQSDVSTTYASYNSSPVAEAAFWTMLNEGDGASGSRLIFEPNVDYKTTAGADNYAYIGYHNPLVSVLSYYHAAGDGSSTGPSHTFYSGGAQAGMYKKTTTQLAFVTNGADQIGIYDGGIFPLKGTLGDDTNNGTTAYRWKKGWFIDLHSTNAPSDDSDRRLKDNIQPNTLGLDFVNDLNPVSYKWKDEGVDTSTHYGIIAQDIIETLKDYGIDSLDDFGGIVLDTEKDRYGARYTEFIPILIKAVQELSAEIKELKEKN